VESFILQKKFIFPTQKNQTIGDKMPKRDRTRLYPKDCTMNEIQQTFGISMVIFENEEVHRTFQGSGYQETTETPGTFYFLTIASAPLINQSFPLSNHAVWREEGIRSQNNH
jgi:hypothetical protein